MVLTVYADRRSSEVGDIGHRLAEALTVLVTPSDVALLGPHSSRAHVRGVRRSTLDDVSHAGVIEKWLASDGRACAVAVVALAGPPAEHVIAAFDASDRVLLLGDPSVSSMRGMQRTLKLFHSLGYSIARSAVVLYDFGDDAPLAPDDASHALKREIFWTLPGLSAPAAEQDHAYAGLAARLIVRT